MIHVLLSKSWVILTSVSHSGKFTFNSRPVLLCLFVHLDVWMPACSCMFSYLGDYLQEGNTLSYLLPSEQDGPPYIHRNMHHTARWNYCYFYTGGAGLLKACSTRDWPIHGLVSHFNLGSASFNETRVCKCGWMHVTDRTVELENFITKVPSKVSVLFSLDPLSLSVFRQAGESLKWSSNVNNFKWHSYPQYNSMDSWRGFLMTSSV